MAPINDSHRRSALLCGIDLSVRKESREAKRAAVRIARVFNLDFGAGEKHTHGPGACGGRVQRAPTTEIFQGVSVADFGWMCILKGHPLVAPKQTHTLFFFNSFCILCIIHGESQCKLSGNSKHSVYHITNPLKHALAHARTHTFTALERLSGMPLTWHECIILFFIIYCQTIWHVLNKQWSQMFCFIDKWTG